MSTELSEWMRLAAEEYLSQAHPNFMTDMVRELAEIIARHCPSAPQSEHYVNLRLVVDELWRILRYKQGNAAAKDEAVTYLAKTFVADSSASPSALAATPPTSTDDVQQAIGYLLLCWTVFYAKLPDGEYDGLGEMRQAVIELKKFEATPPSGACLQRSLRND